MFCGLDIDVLNLLSLIPINQFKTIFFMMKYTKMLIAKLIHEKYIFKIVYLTKNRSVQLSMPYFVSIEELWNYFQNIIIDDILCKEIDRIQLDLNKNVKAYIIY